MPVFSFLPGSWVADTGEWSTSEEAAQPGGGVPAPEPDPDAGTVHGKPEPHLTMQCVAN